MNNFDVFEHPEKGRRAVKKGFSWTAFFFTVLWAFYNNLWKVGVCALILIVFLVGLERWLKTNDIVFGLYVVFFLRLYMFIYLGKMGNRWKAESLKSQGYQYMKNCNARTEGEAID